MATNDMSGCGSFNFEMNRRDFFSRFGYGLGGMALAHLLGDSVSASSVLSDMAASGAALDAPHFEPKAKRVIYLFQSGGPSQLDLFDYKPLLNEMNGQDLPDSVRMGQRLTGMSANQASLPLAGSIFDFKRRGKSGAWVSDLLPYTAGIADDLCFVKSLYTEAINHDPAMTFFQTGAQQPGRPAMGSWLSYGLGSENANLPSFIVMISKNGSGQPLYSRLWGNGFLPSSHQGVQFRAGKDPVLYLGNPPGISMSSRREVMDHLARLHEQQYQDLGDPAINSRVAQYEMAFRMQTSVPEVMDTSDEPEAILDMYGEDARNPGTYAANCLLARRLAERGVRFIQLYHQGWDHHGGLPNGIRSQSKKTDQASAALIKDLKQRGLLDDTIVIWGGEFGRTNYSQGALTEDNYGRDHHPRCFTQWIAGGGFKPGISYGETDEFGYNVARNPVHVHDLQATLLQQLGIDHKRLTFKHQGRRYRLTDVGGHVVNEIIS